MRRLIVQRTAQRHLNDITRHIARQSGSRTTATSFVVRLRGQCRHLASLPGTLGRARSDLGDNRRSFAWQGYIVVFRYEPNVFRVFAIIEGHRDLGPLLIDLPNESKPN